MNKLNRAIAGALAFVVFALTVVAGSHAAEQFTNFALTTLASSIQSTDTSLTVSSTTNFPSSTPFRLTIQDSAASTPEIVYVTAISGNTYTITRGYEGTVATAHSAGAQVAQFVTAGVIQSLWNEAAASLLAANNLSDLGNVATARTNLGLAPSATTDTTNASNISSGTLTAARLPAPTGSSLGGVQSYTAPSNQFVTGISTAGVPVSAQPSASNISGLAASATTDTTNATNITSGTLAITQGGTGANSVSGAQTNLGIPSTALVWRGMGQRMYLQVQGFGGGTNWSQTRRTRHYSNYAFRYYRIVIPTFYTTGSPIADTNLPNNMTWQVGFEYPYVNANSGIPTRQTVTWSSATSVSYSTGAAPTTGYLVSDIMDAGQTIPAGAFFGLWKTDETSSGAGSNSLPYTDAMTNFFERYEGYAASGASQVAAGTALTASSIAHSGTSQTGLSQGSTPAFMLIQIPANLKVVAGVGDSIDNGTGEGNSGSTNSLLGVSTNYGDALGSALSNAGYPARIVQEKLGYNFIDFGRGSDRLQYITSGNWVYRLQLLTLANPTHIYAENIVNDITSGASVSTIKAALQNALSLFKAAVPGAPIIQACATPASSDSVDNFATTAQQTPQFNNGGVTSVRGQMNEYIRGLRSGVNKLSYYDPNPIVESGYQYGIPFSTTSFWNSYNNMAYYCTPDGTHPNSFCDSEIANGVQVDPFQ